MFSSIALIKEFLSHWVGIVVVVIVLGLVGVVVFEKYQNTALTSQIASLNQTIGSLKTGEQEWQSSAKNCSDGVAAVAASQVAVTEAASQAVATATVKAKVYENHAKQILAQKPTSNDDYTASKQLMDGLIDTRQAQLKGNQNAN